MGREGVDRIRLTEHMDHYSGLLKLLRVETYRFD
jgi:hypothetical protein